MVKCPNVPTPVKKEMQRQLDARKKKVLTEQKRDAEYEAYREEVFGPREKEVISSDKQGENMRSYNEDEESRRTEYEAACRGGQPEHGGSSVGGGMLHWMFSQKQPR